MLDGGYEVYRSSSSQKRIKFFSSESKTFLTIGFDVWERLSAEYGISLSDDDVVERARLAYEDAICRLPRAGA